MASGGRTPKVRSPRVSNPGSTCANRATLEVISPAPIASSNARAICTVTSVAWVRVRPRTVASRVRSARWGATRPAARAGSRPVATPTTRVRSTVKANTGQPKPIAAATAGSLAADRIASIAHNASSTPRVAPTLASNRLSVRS